MSHTKEYQELLQLNHSQWTSEKGWGSSGARNFGPQVTTFLENRTNVLTVLDFGAGQRSLEAHVIRRLPDRGLRWTNYDPGIPELSGLPDNPKGYDLVVSSDVLEHVEPAEVDETLEQLHKYTRRYQYHCIACDPCMSRLPDGRNAHLTVEQPRWWRDKFEQYGTIMRYEHVELTKKSRTRTYAIIQIDR